MYRVQMANFDIWFRQDDFVVYDWIYHTNSVITTALDVDDIICPIKCCKRRTLIC